MSTTARSTRNELLQQQQRDEPMSPGTLSSKTIRSFNKHAQRQLVEEQRQAMIENFDMEVEDKIRSMRAQLEADKMDLLLKAECEIAQLPKCVRDMPLKTFIHEYGGDMTAAVRGMLKLDDENSSALISLPEAPLAIRNRRKKAAAAAATALIK
ncbi:hypothetical protein GGI25_004543 [Coemansia spiralis]|uniref:Borealin N-terminal domain-containing protein n=2 Tax=Coemansia TaxID=4863 RepID=A0A9W8KVI2_9FUNG|nr:hypothetical protein BX070DRAFT_254880 [Coemansia spiralis]KAJ1990187.1 hypothetical protein EDC05_004243 [Coemansia umbellata]KAJ2620713.1 hypothetical protein GGI26_004791 [Coemansia sp. RSA 1358]KAJ2673976.1 hypothetical protein GGI25_004543 [Coemansia spiralis]